MSQFPTYAAAFVVALGLLVVVHEFGHYLIARWCGVRVLRFSIGFGPKLWRRRLGADGTEWAIGLIPLGGYVQMLDESEGEVEPADLPRAFNRQTVGKRSLIVAAGPLANFLLACVLYWGLFIYGSAELLPRLGEPAAGTPAARAAIADGDLVRAVAGKPVLSWDDFRWRLLERAAVMPAVDLDVLDADEQPRQRHLELAAIAEQGWEGDALGRLGVALYRPRLPALIGKVVAGGRGAAGGLQEGDRVLAVDGKPVVFWHEFVKNIRESADRPLQIEIERAGQRLTLTATPEAAVERGQTIGRLGIALAEGLPGQREMRVFIRHAPLDAAWRALAETWNQAVFSLRMMGKMLVGEASLKNLSGPIAIADYAGQSASLGLDYYLRFLALLSVSLGVLNLLPVPVLDGGHLMYHTIEVVRRRPLSRRAMQIGQQIGLSLLLALMAFAFFNDLSRLLNG